MILSHLLWSGIKIFPFRFSRNTSKVEVKPLPCFFSNWEILKLVPIIVGTSAGNPIEMSDQYDLDIS